MAVYKMLFHYDRKDLDYLDAPPLQLTSSGPAITATDVQAPGLFVNPYRSCWLSCHMKDTSGGGHDPGQPIWLCGDNLKGLHPPVGHLCGHIWYGPNEYILE